ncbi:hypothetical protein FisN_10Lu421 [Fistulifera solaris]|uniref:Uncharacterized protein n=1 Tax=Fistulifera solaris TaxID=1519565 RepID=A0A1Z5JV33_FISSO|nr:hypothetical protein FisN_10Lu421 [Fistulifera solaris]|eukprot:GAX17702.1 hypothetical protein FisN_10Lu421 [Fistulifera solaris]
MNVQSAITNELFLKRIPERELSSRQKELRKQFFGDDYICPYLYQWLRKPTHFEDIDWEEYDEIMIWCENETFFLLWYDALYKTRPATFSIINESERFVLNCFIHGESHTAIADTTTFFLSLKYRTNTITSLRVNSYIIDDEEGSILDFSSLSPEQLARILDANPSRHLELQTGSWSIEQSTILATRPYPLILKIVRCSGFAFQDDGVAFVSALGRRHTPFGSLDIECNTDGLPFCRHSLQRLFKLENMFDKLTLCELDEESALLPLSAKVKALDYRMDEKYFQLNSFDSLFIAPMDLDLRIVMNDESDWTILLISLLNRVAELGHFAKLGISIWKRGQHEFEHLKTKKHHLVADALVNAIAANPRLSCLDLSGTSFPPDLGPYLRNVFQAMEDHSSLCLFKIETYPRTADPNYSWLERLLSRNRNMIVLSSWNQKFTNGASIDKMYALNHFFRGSADLIIEHPLSRSSLIGTTLVESASTNFQYIALLLSDHTDVLLEWIDDLI